MYKALISSRPFSFSLSSPTHPHIHRAKTHPAFSLPLHSHTHTHTQQHQPTKKKLANMHFSSLTLGLMLAASTSTLAAPTPLFKRLYAIPLAIYSYDKCDPSVSVTTAYIPTDGSCFQPSPIFSGNTNSFSINPADLARLPKGCTCKLLFLFFSFPFRSYMPFILDTGQRALFPSCRGYPEG